MSNVIQLADGWVERSATCWLRIARRRIVARCRLRAVGWIWTVKTDRVTLADAAPSLERAIAAAEAVLSAAGT